MGGLVEWPVSYGWRDLEIVDRFGVSVAELETAHGFTLPAVFDA